MPNTAPDIESLGAISTPRQAGQYVRKIREASGYTRAQLSKSAGVSERLLASLELGDATGIRLDKLLSVLNALGIELTATQTTPDKTVTPPAAKLSSAACGYSSLLADIAREQGVDLGTPEES